MALQSQLFRNDPRLEAAAVSDPAHILPNASGPHVGKIQVALLNLDGAVIASDELRSLAYGPTTARAVLQYKQKRNIINRNYQQQADNIVGRMTMAALDKEMRDNEPLTGVTRIKPLYATRKAPLVTPAMALNEERITPRLTTRLGFFQGGPQIVIPNTPPPPAFVMDLAVGASSKIQVIDGAGGMVSSSNEDILHIADPGEPNAHTGGALPVVFNPHLFKITGRSLGRTHVVATSKARTAFGAMLAVNVHAALPAREVTMAFHFLGGAPAKATQRNRATVLSALGEMNDIYNHATNIKFRAVSIDASPLQVPEFKQQDGLLLFKVSGRTEDWKALVGHRTSAHVNVFFVRDFLVIDQSPLKPAPIGLSDSPISPGFVSRDTAVVDDLRSTSLGHTLAHEMGHSLGEPDNQLSGELMNVSAPGRAIPPAMAKRMNDQAGKL